MNTNNKQTSEVAEIPHKSRLTRKPMYQAVVSALFLAGLTTPMLAQAQDAPSRTQSVMLEEVIITARKRDESMQDVPVAVQALNSEQIEALKIRDITNLAIGMPNVSLDDTGTFKGTANFMIRGLGINSSIPSIDPTVGIFQDGVYMGVNFGVIFDTFDLESIEVLRGPQGQLFGRNVTGGAVLLNTKKPSEEFAFSARVAADGNPNGDGGINSYAMASVGGPLSDSLGAKISVYRNKDDGWFVNELDGEEHGGFEQKMIRPVVEWNATDDLNIVLRYEYADISGDGPAAQNHTNGSGVPGTPTNYSRKDFGFSNDEKGFQEATVKFFTSEINWNVGFGNGLITNVFGWRDYDSSNLSDIDAQPVPLFHAAAELEAEQYSNELRYNGRFFDEKANVTTGVYYFTNDISYAEGRQLLGTLTPDGSPAQTQDGGGLYKVDTYAIFAATDYDLTEAWTLNAGIRYTYEEKKADIASLSANVNEPCNVVQGSCPYDFQDDEDWDSVAPKLGATFHVNDDQLAYGHWTRAYRSGGYNLRNTSQDPINFGPGPFDEEEVNSYEIGYKGSLMDNRARLNAAVFYTDVADMQREVNLSDPNSGVVQILKNTADADIWGLEVDGTFSLLDNLLVMASVGYTDASYSSVKFDLNGDGVVDSQDEDLDLPRVAEWTYSLGLNLDTELGNYGYMSSRVNYAYRDDAAYTDNNLGYFNSVDMVNAGIDWHSANEKWVVSLYGRNLLDETNHGGDTQLPALLGPVELGGTFSPLMKGRTVGLELTYTY
jgi:iron complex outermembrane receptor protein